MAWRKTVMANTSAFSSVDWQFACRGIRGKGLNSSLESKGSNRCSIGDHKSRTQLGYFCWVLFTNTDILLT